MAVIDTDKITTPTEAKDLICAGILKLSDMNFDYLGLKKSEIFKMSFPDNQSYELGIDLFDLLGAITNQFLEEE